MKKKNPNPALAKELNNLLGKNVNVHFKSDYGYAFANGKFILNGLGNHSIITTEGFVSFSILKVKNIQDNDIYIELDNFLEDSSQYINKYSYFSNFIEPIIKNKSIVIIFTGRTNSERFALSNNNLKFDKERQFYTLYKSHKWFINFEFSAIAKIDPTSDLIYLNLNKN